MISKVSVFTPRMNQPINKKPAKNIIIIPSIYSNSNCLMACVPKSSLTES